MLRKNSRPSAFPPDLPVCSVMQEQTGSSRLLPGRLDAGYMLLESGRLQIVRLANIEGLYGDPTKFLIAGDFELSDRTHLKEHLLNGKTLLLDLSKSDSLRKLSDCYQDQLSYIACNAKGYWGLYAPLIRPDSFIAWASDNFSDDSKAI